MEISQGTESEQEQAVGMEKLPHELSGDSSVGTGGGSPLQKKSSLKKIAKEPTAPSDSKNKMAGLVRKTSQESQSGVSGVLGSGGTRPIRSDAVNKAHSIWWALDNLPPSMLIGKERQESEKKQKESVPTTIINPGSRFKLVWDLVALAFLLYFMFAVPFRLCFIDTQSKNDAQCGQEREQYQCDAFVGCQWSEDDGCIVAGRNFLVFWFDSFVDMFFLVDIALNFRTAYQIQDERGGLTIETNSRKIAFHYLRTWFLFDLVGSLPLDLIFYFIGQDDSGPDYDADGGGAGESVLIGLHRLLRFAKAFRLLKLMRAVRIQRIVEELQEMASINPGLFRVLQFIFVFLFVAHVMACVLFLLGTHGAPFHCLESVGGQCTPHVRAEDRYVTWITRTPMMTRQFGEVVVADAPVDTQYAISVYWAFTIMTTVGFGDIKPLTTHEVITVILCMLVGASTFSYVVGNMATLITNLDAKAGAFNDKMEQVTVFLHDNSVPRDLRARIRKYYDYAFTHPQVAASHSALQELSPALRLELLRLLRKNSLASAALFRAIPPEPRDRLLSTLLELLAPSQHGPGDPVFHQEELGRHVVLVLNGEVDLVAGEADLVAGEAGGAELIATLGKGSCFGETALIPGFLRRPYTARCRTWCDLLWLDARELDVRLQEVADAASAVRLTARVRWERMEGAMAAHRVLTHASRRGLDLTGRELLDFIGKVEEQGGWERGVNLSAVEGGDALYHDIKDLMLSSAGGRRLMEFARETGPRGAGAGGWSWSADWVDGSAVHAEVVERSREWGSAALAERAWARESEESNSPSTGNAKPGPNSRVRHGFESTLFSSQYGGAGRGQSRAGGRLSSDGGEGDGAGRGQVEVGRGIRGIDAEADEMAPGVDLERTLHEMVKRIDIIETQIARYSSSASVAELMANVRRIGNSDEQTAVGQVEGEAGGERKGIEDLHNKDDETP